MDVMNCATHILIFFFNFKWNLITSAKGEEYKITFFNNKGEFDDELPLETPLFDYNGSHIVCVNHCRLYDSCLAIYYNRMSGVCYGYEYRQVTSSNHSASGFSYWERVLNCDLGYALVGRRKVCLRLLPSEYSWPLGREICQSEGADLVILDTEEKHGDLKNYVFSVGSSFHGISLGMSDMDIEGVWKWVDGQNISSTYTNWKVGEPNSFDDGYAGYEADCASVHNSAWFDRYCYRYYKIVCEKRAN